MIFIVAFRQLVYSTTGLAFCQYVFENFYFLFQINIYFIKTTTIFIDFALNTYIFLFVRTINKKSENNMIAILIRTVLIYLLLNMTIRVMGKRQLGELDVGELVITILLSEIAATPITNPEKPLLQSVIPIATLASLEILSSVLILRNPLCKRLFSSKPAVLVERGVIKYNMMKKVRISLEELVSQVRQNGIYDLCEVDYAILEENGKMSVIPKSANRQPDMRDMKIPFSDKGIMHIIISDGCLNSHGLALINKDKAWVERKIKKLGIPIKDIFCMTVDDAGNIFIQTRHGKQIIR